MNALFAPPIETWRCDSQVGCVSSDPISAKMKFQAFIYAVLLILPPFVASLGIFGAWPRALILQASLTTLDASPPT